MSLRFSTSLCAAVLGLAALTACSKPASETKAAASNPAPAVVTAVPVAPAPTTAPATTAVAAPDEKFSAEEAERQAQHYAEREEQLELKADVAEARAKLAEQALADARARAQAQALQAANDRANAMAGAAGALAEENGMLRDQLADEEEQAEAAQNTAGLPLESGVLLTTTGPRHHRPPPDASTGSLITPLRLPTSTLQPLTPLVQPSHAGHSDHGDR